MNIQARAPASPNSPAKGQETLMDTRAAILGRVTTPPVKMTEPGPDRVQLDALIAAAAAAPDHGKLRPWRFLIVQGRSRHRLGDLFADAVEVESPDASRSEIDKQRSAPLRAPLLVIAIARLVPDHRKIPEIEQIASAAAAVQNMLTMAHAMGFAAKWSTGRNAYSDHVAKGLGLTANERIIGIIYLGSGVAAQELPPRPTVSEISAIWQK